MWLKNDPLARRIFDLRLAAILTIVISILCFPIAVYLWNLVERVETSGNLMLESYPSFVFELKRLVAGVIGGFDVMIFGFAIGAYRIMSLLKKAKKEDFNQDEQQLRAMMMLQLIAFTLGTALLLFLVFCFVGPFREMPRVSERDLSEAFNQVLVWFKWIVAGVFPASAAAVLALGLFCCRSLNLAFPKGK